MRGKLMNNRRSCVLIHKRRALFFIIAFCLWFLMSGCDRSPLNFENVSHLLDSNSGLGGHGVIFADVDGNGLADLYLPLNHNQPMKDMFYLNKADEGFIELGELAGVADFDGGSHGSCFADLDNDGDFDLVNGATYPAGDVSAAINIYRNDGFGYFEDFSDLRVFQRADSQETRGVVCFDMDGDGDIDIFSISGYLGTTDPDGDRNEVYRNDGDFHFTALDDEVLVRAPAGQGGTDCDYDGDGDVDILAANRSGDLNILNNDGAGHFESIEPQSLGMYDKAEDGITCADIDNDGDMDLLLASDGSGILYRNDAGNFVRQQTF